MIYRFSLYGFLKNLRLFEPFIILLFREDGLSFLQIGLLYSIRDIATNIRRFLLAFMLMLLGAESPCYFRFQLILSHLLSFIYFQ